MTYKELKMKQDKIKELRLDIADIEDQAEKTTQTFSSVPSGSGTSDKVGSNAIRIVYIQKQIESIETEIEAELERLSDTLIRKCIRLRLKNKRYYTWKKLSFVIGGGNTAESVRKMCERVVW